MTDNKPIDKSPSGRTFFLRKWGLFSVVIGFLVLLQELFGSNFYTNLLAIVLIGVTLPRTERKLHGSRVILAIVGYFGFFMIVFLGLSWFSKTFGLNTGMVLSAGFLAIGIFLLILVETLQQPRSLDNDDAIGRMIVKIRRL